MIDWWGLVSNLLWVVGLAIVLAAFSMAHYRARTGQVRLRQWLRGAGFQFPFCIGIILVGLGVALSGQEWWEKIIGGLVALAFVVEALRLWRRQPTDLPSS
jgi:ABC-type nickel/cobalt efflux system permease component RcnA